MSDINQLGESQKNPKKYFNINVTGTQNLLSALKKTNVKNIIFSSTCAVYETNLKPI